MKKKILMIVSVLLIAVLMIPLTGCSTLLETSQPDQVVQPDTDTDIYDIQWSNMFKKVGSDSEGPIGEFYIYRETTTDIMYMLFRDHSKAGLTVMLASDGTPLLYPEWVAMQTNVCDNCGAENNTDFCNKCGAGLSDSPDAPATTEPTAPETAVKDTCVSCGTQCDTAYCPNCGTKQ